MYIKLFIFFSQNFENFKSKWCILSAFLKYELINSSTTKIYMKKVSHYVEAI